MSYDNDTNHLTKVEQSNYSLILNQEANDERVIDEILGSLRSHLNNSKSLDTSNLNNDGSNRLTRKRRITKINTSDEKSLVKKGLTFTLNETYFTNGKPLAKEPFECELQQIIGTKRHLYKKQVLGLGDSSPANFVVSDTISIDIDPESTRLPMMCKLMIIVEGATLERGIRLLVRDAAVQADLDDYSIDAHVLHKSSSTRSQIPIKIVYDNDYNQNDFNSNSSRFTKSKLLKNRYHSSENLNRSSRRNNSDHGTSRDNYCNTDSLSHSGSLSNIYTSNENNKNDLGTFNSCWSLNNQAPSQANTQGILKNKAKRESSLLKSYIGLNNDDYVSIPYYQYQSKSSSKCDACVDTADFELYLLEHTTTTRTTMITRRQNYDTDVEDEMIELEIPIEITSNHMETSCERHRNEKHFIVNKAFNDDFDRHVENFETLRSNARRYLNERLNRFEAEITFYNLDHHNHASLTPKLIYTKPLCCDHLHHHHLSHHQTHCHHHCHHHRCRHGEPCQQQRRERYVRNASSSYQNISNENSKLYSEPSVTNLMLMQIIDGQLID